MKNSLLFIAVLLSGFATTNVSAAVTYHATIKLEDGTPLPSIPLVMPGRNKDLLEQCRVLNVFGNGTVSYWVDPRLVSKSEEFAWTEDSCLVTIRLAGYREAKVVLKDGSTVVLKRMGDAQGATVSVTNLNAPEPARKAYEKGVGSLMKGNLDAAAKELKLAVELYPDYVQAWSDLGEVYEKQHAPLKARDACTRALNADPKYIRPYVQLARLAIDDSRFADAAEITSRALALKSGPVAAVFFYDAVANYNLKNYDLAEKSAIRAIELDTNGEIPMAEQVLGSTLAAKGDVTGALDHLYNYLQRSPLASDAGEVKKTIAELERK